MRARKRNPHWGQGLDKRQARRARRHRGRRADRIARFVGSAGFQLEGLRSRAQVIEVAERQLPRRGLQ